MTSYKLYSSIIRLDMKLNTNLFVIDRYILLYSQGTLWVWVAGKQASEVTLKKGKLKIISLCIVSHGIRKSHFVYTPSPTLFLCYDSYLCIHCIVFFLKFDNNYTLSTLFFFFLKDEFINQQHFSITRSWLN